MLFLLVLAVPAWGQNDFLEGKPAWLDISTDILKGKPSWLQIPGADAPGGPVAPDGITPAIELPPPAPEIPQNDPVFEAPKVSTDLPIRTESIELGVDEVLSSIEPSTPTPTLTGKPIAGSLLRQRISTAAYLASLFSSGPVVEAWTPVISTTTLPRPFRDPTGKGRFALKAITHLHSKISQSGVLEMEELARLASEAGIDVLIPTDHVISTWEYGVWPFRGILKKKVTNSSILEFGAAKYIERVKALEDSHPGLITIPGMEVAPFYRWTGSVVHGLTLEDWHRHLIVIGLDTAEAIENLPVMGSPSGRRFEPFLLWPLGLFLLAWLFKKARIRSAMYVMIGLGFLGLLEGFPYMRYPDSSHQPRTPWTPYQRVVDYVQGQGAISFWAHPESVSFKKGRKVSSKVTIRTVPYPSAIRRVINHGGFGVFMEGYRKIAQADGAWDGSLRQFIRGSRVVAPWAFGELDFRRPGMNNTQIDTVQMIVLAEERSAAGVFRALRAGSFYTERMDGHPAMILERWTVSNSSETAGTGETLYSTNAATVDVAVSHADGVPRTVSMELIRDGESFVRRKGTTPIGWRIEDEGGQANSGFYRVILRDENRVRLITNPIFRSLSGRPSQR